VSQKPSSHALFEKSKNLIPAISGTKKPSFSGYLDSIVDTELTGWAKTSADFVFVRVYQNGKMMAEVQPNLYRDDLNGKHGFKLKLPVANVYDEFARGNIKIFLEPQDGATKTPISINGELNDNLVISNFSRQLSSIRPSKLHDIFFKIHERFYNLGDSEERHIHNAHLITYTKQVFGGFLEAIENDVLVGWARGIGVPVIVRVYENSSEIGAIVPYISREDVAGKFGFRLKILVADLKDNILAGKINIYIETIDGLHRSPIDFHSSLYVEGSLPKISDLGI
jgi:hypothetical protein